MIDTGVRLHILGRVAKSLYAVDWGTVTLRQDSGWQPVWGLR